MDATSQVDAESATYGNNKPASKAIEEREREFHLKFWKVVDFFGRSQISQ